MSKNVKQPKGGKMIKYLTIVVLVLAIASILLWAVFPTETAEYAQIQNTADEAQ